MMILLNHKAKRVVLCLLTVFLWSCADERISTVPEYPVEEIDFAIRVSGFGEIEAAQAQRIISPGIRPMTLSWLKEENTMVEAGDIIARFDAQQILKDSREEEFEMRKLEQDIARSTAQQSQQMREVESDQVFVKHEFEFVDKFAIDDLRIYSQLEIIDTLENRDFLVAKDGFLDWKENSIDEQAGSEMAVLDIRRQGHATKFERHQKALSGLEVVSPYSGLLIYEKDRRGEKPSVGQTIFPGRPIAQIPNLDNMQAKVFVLANDAIDLDAGQAVEIRLDAFPDEVFNGEISNVAGFPRSIERGNPVTYYEVTVSLNQQDKSMMQPGRKLTANIDVKLPSKRLAIPLQALHHENGSSYVYVNNGADYVKTIVESGRKNLYLVEIISGLSVGDVIALSPPPDAVVASTVVASTSAASAYPRLSS
ncbi:efflux RND transporter periplasmic adaptor subunit [Glaciecola siphonariae]|uniref:Efflux RND transporter periplasmic adaptor subunit n=1 Tax=Glaciecola siphonariae TaxID=521012 RepID=A0ABV9M0I0_9ALTE